MLISSVSGKDLLPHRQGGRGRGALWVSVIRALIPLVEPPPSRPNHLPKVPSPKLESPWGLGFNSWIWGDTNIQSRAHALELQQWTHKVCSSRAMTAWRWEQTKPWLRGNRGEGTCTGVYGICGIYSHYIDMFSWSAMSDSSWPHGL